MSTVVQPFEMQTPTGLRVFPIDCDSMEPTLKRGGYALVAPCSDYNGEGLYVLDNGIGTAIYRVAKSAPFRESTIFLLSDNSRYKRHEVSLEWFRGAVLAQVAAKVEIMNSAVFEGREPYDGRLG